MTLCRRAWSTNVLGALSLRRNASTLPKTSKAALEAEKSLSDKPSSKTTQQADTTASKKQSQLDAELKEKLETLSGGGGISGLELEDGKPVAMKRGTRENMFRLI